MATYPARYAPGASRLLNTEPHFHLGLEWSSGASLPLHAHPRTSSPCSAFELVPWFSSRIIPPSCLPKATFLGFPDLAPCTKPVLNKQTFKETWKPSQSIRHGEAALEHEILGVLCSYCLKADMEQHSHRGGCLNSWQLARSFGVYSVLEVLWAIVSEK